MGSVTELPSMRKTQDKMASPTETTESRFFGGIGLRGSSTEGQKVTNGMREERKREPMQIFKLEVLVGALAEFFQLYVHDTQYGGVV